MNSLPSFNAWRAMWVTFALLLWPLVAQASHFSVTLDVSDANAKQTAKTETEPSKAREVVVRPTMQTMLGKHCTAKFKITCTGKEGLKDAMIHFYVVKIDKAGQNPPPLEPK